MVKLRHLLYCFTQSSKQFLDNIQLETNGLRATIQTKKRLRT